MYIYICTYFFLRKIEKKIKENTEQTEQAIQDILDELAQHEKEQKEIEAYTEVITFDAIIRLE